MTKSFGSLVFTPVVKALQERYGSRQYARMGRLGDAPGGLGPDEKEYLSERDTFYMASLGESGWPYVQHRGGPKGFLKVIDNNALPSPTSEETSNTSVQAFSWPTIVSRSFWST